MTSEQTFTASSNSLTAQEQKTNQSYQIRYKNWQCTVVHLQPAGAGKSASPAYVVASHMRKPNLVFRAPSNASSKTNSTQLFAETRWHSFSTKIDVQVNGTELQLAPKSWWKIKEYNFFSNACNRTLTWRSHTSWKQQSWICIDEQATPLAKAGLNSWKWKEIGSFEFVEGTLSPSVKEELIATGMTMLFHTMIQHSGAAAAAGSG